MTVSDMQRRDLYNGSEEVLGADRANILMTYLRDPGALATKSDLDHRFDNVDRRFEVIEQRFEAVDRRFERLEVSLSEVNRRLDRLFLAVVTALLAMVATVWTQTVLG